ncbi:uncharacterized protein [Amphiura filiformis]|uniref:uncharacterized protein n=1 Tax=Amphiura filiformis TaxID=82378 RepID=UPI003B20FCA5
MDVKLGCCWRCENPIKGDVACDSCGEAKYCSERCRFRDQWRHTPECAEWKPKQCSNPKCGKVSGQLRECSACCNAWYCEETCQRQHWKDHKLSCRKRTQDIKEASASLYVTFQNHSGKGMGYPYYIGNALAIDMLNLQGNELLSKDVTSAKTEQDPLECNYSILSAGCGNLRNWIHTVASLPKEFKGTLHTVLNDFDPYMQARNVLQLYMMIMYSDDPNIAERITTIWYSLQLPEEGYKFLIDCLRALLGLSADDIGKVTGGVLQITESDMYLMREVWKAWLELECRKGNKKYIDLQEQRKRLLIESQTADEGIKLYRRGLPNEMLRSFDEYNKNGNFISHVNARSCILAYDNPTLTGFVFAQAQVANHDVKRIPTSGRFVYCIEYHLMAFSEWDYLKVKKHHYNKSMVVMFHSFISDQIKQTIASIKARTQRVSIIIWNCLDLSARFNVESYQFDRIFTSNIADFSGTQTLLKAMKPFLNRANKCSTIITQYWNWYFIVPYAKMGGLPRITAAQAPAASQHTAEMISCTNLVVLDINSDDEKMLSRLQNPLVMIEECTKVMDRGYNFLQEYFNNMIWFVIYLRAEYLAVNKGSQSTKPPSFQKVKQSEGLQLRDFRRGNSNKVVPFRYRRNARLGVNLMHGMDRMLEWHFA